MEAGNDLVGLVASIVRCKIAKRALATCNMIEYVLVETWECSSFKPPRRSKVVRVPRFWVSKSKFENTEVPDSPFFCCEHIGICGCFQLCGAAFRIRTEPPQSAILRTVFIKLNFLPRPAPIRTDPQKLTAKLRSAATLVPINASQIWSRLMQHPIMI
jgi:hypothetical protein